MISYKYRLFTDSVEGVLLKEVERGQVGAWQVRPWGALVVVGKQQLCRRQNYQTYLLSYMSFCTYAQSRLVALNYTGAVCQNCFPKTE